MSFCHCDKKYHFIACVDCNIVPDRCNHNGVHLFTFKFTLMAAGAMHLSSLQTLIIVAILTEIKAIMNMWLRH